jgi:hypothetical protein
MSVNAGVGVLVFGYLSCVCLHSKTCVSAFRWVSVFLMVEWDCVAQLLAFGNIDAMYLYSKLQSIIQALFPAVPDRFFVHRVTMHPSL